MYPPFTTSDVLIPIKLTYGLDSRAEDKFHRFLDWFDILDFREIAPKHKRKWQYEFTGIPKNHLDYELKIVIWVINPDGFNDNLSNFPCMSLRSVKHRDKHCIRAGKFHHIVSNHGVQNQNVIRSLDWAVDFPLQERYLAYCIAAYETFLASENKDENKVST